MICGAKLWRDSVHVKQQLAQNLHSKNSFSLRSVFVLRFIALTYYNLHASILLWAWNSLQFQDSIWHQNFKCSWSQRCKEQSYKMARLGLMVIFFLFTFCLCIHRQTAVCPFLLQAFNLAISRQHLIRDFQMYLKPKVSLKGTTFAWRCSTANMARLGLMIIGRQLKTCFLISFRNVKRMW